MSCDTPARLTHYFGRCHLNHIKVKSSQVKSSQVSFSKFFFGVPNSQDMSEATLASDCPTSDCLAC
jgi:hypothetical protein